MTLFTEVKNPDNCELIGPVMCTACNGYLMLDATYIDQVSAVITCPYCQSEGRPPISLIGEEG